MTAFQEALSDFMYDMASGGAIRQMAARGYSVSQIMKALDFPTPRERVERTVYRYLLEAGILLQSLPEDAEGYKMVRLPSDAGRRQLSECLHKHIQENGEDHSYMLCPFGKWQKNNAEQLEDRLSALNQREREYLMELPFASNEMYHSLNGRMYEISIKLVLSGALEGKFYFLKERLVMLATDHSSCANN